MSDFDAGKIQQEISSKEGDQEDKSGQFSLFKKFLVAILLLLITTGGYVIYQLKYANDPDKITIGYSTDETFALVTLAQQQGFFEEAGVAVEYRKFQADSDVLEALNENKIDMAVVEDIEFVMTLPPQTNQKVLASISSAQSYFYVLDVKKGLLGIEDLVGKNIGMVDGNGINYWFEKSIPSRRDVHVKKIKQNKLAREFADAKVDAVFAKQPLIYQTENFERTNIQALRIPAQGQARSNTLLVVNEEFLTANRSEIKDFLEVLYKTENLYIQQQEDFTEVLLSTWNMEKGYLDNILKDHQYSLELNVPLKEVLSSQYSWKSQKSRSRGSADFVLDSIFYYPLLREVKPEAVGF